MTHNHFYDGDAAPLTGKSPVQVRVRGGAMSEATLAGVRGVLNSFLGGTRISLAQNLQKAVRLPGGVEVRMSSRYGVVSVEVDIPPTEASEDDTPEFFGGIVIRPIYYPDESVLFGPAFPNFSDEGSPVPEVTTKGEAPGRPAVPGTKTTDITNWLVVQIARDKPLDDEPVKNGAVKIYRIKDPLVGNRIEANFTPERYLLSASDALDEFYICGARVLNLPPLPISVAPTEVRIRTYRFQPKSFEQAETTEGFVIVAADRKLYAIDTRNRPLEGSPTWQLLATGTFDDPIQYLNEFGLDFAEEVAPSGTTTVVCSGSNGAGVCSGFRVTITPVPDARPTLSGEIYPMHDGSVPAVPNVRVYSATLDVSGTITSTASPDTWNGGSVSGPLATTYRGSNISYSRTRAKTAGAGEIVRDRIFGGELPRYSSGASSDEVTISFETSFYDWVLGEVYPFPDPPNYNQNKAAVFSTTSALTWTVSQEGSTSDQRIKTVEYAYDFSSFAGNLDEGAESELPASANSYTREISAITDLPPDPVLERAVTGRDVFSQIIWQRRAIRTAIRAVPESVTGTISGDPTNLGVTITPSESVMESTTYSALDLSFSLKQRSGATLYTWADAFSRFESTPAWAGVQVVEEEEDLELMPPVGRTGPGVVTPGGSDNTAAYDDWFPAILLSNFAIDITGFLPVPEGDPLIPTGASSTAFSYSYDYDGSEPTRYPFDDFIDVQPQTVYAYYPGASWSPDFVQVDVAVGPGLFAASDTSGVANPLVYLSTVDRAYYDIRTGGFIAQSIWTHEHSEDNHVTSLEAFIGNDVSLVSLRSVLDEWRALGGLDPATDDKRIVAWFGTLGALL